MKRIIFISLLSCKAIEIEKLCNLIIYDAFHNPVYIQNENLDEFHINRSLISKENLL